MLVVTTSDIPGWEIQRVCGEVFGVTARSRAMLSQRAPGPAPAYGGETQGLLRGLSDSHHEAIGRMLEGVRLKGGNAVVGMRFDSTDLGDGWSELCAYGTAIVAIPVDEGAKATATALGYGQPSGPASGPAAAQEAPQQPQQPFAQPGYPQPGYPPQQPGYPQPGYPEQQPPAYPEQPPAYPEQPPAYPQGYPEQPQGWPQQGEQQPQGWPQQPEQPQGYPQGEQPQGYPQGEQQQSEQQGYPPYPQP